jgi:hypothetical protein
VSGNGVSGPVPSGQCRRRSRFQAVVAQQAGAEQDCVAVNERRVGRKHLTVEWEIDREQVFDRGLPGSEFVLNLTGELWLESVE